MPIFRNNREYTEFVMTSNNTHKLTNRNVVHILDNHQLSKFIIEKSELIFRQYTSSQLGLEDWLDQKADINFWRENFNLFSKEENKDESKSY